VSYVILSYVICHMSYVIGHMSYVICITIIDTIILTNHTNIPHTPIYLVTVQRGGGGGAAGGAAGV
jgi:hypothetical protein